MFLEILLVIAGGLLGFIIAWLLFKAFVTKKYIALNSYDQLKDDRQQWQLKVALITQEKEAALNRQMELNKSLDLSAGQLTRQQAELQSLHITIARLEATVQSKSDKLQTQQQDLEMMKEKIGKEFQLLANEILEAKSKTFNDQQEEKLSVLLHPFKEQIALFKKDFEEKFTEEVREKSSLRTEIANLLNLNQVIAKEAISLTEALRGSTKKQGDWGEGILERILEYSGLQEGIHYTTQTSSRDADGKLIRPDMIVRFPGERFLVIDSKVSLNHYWDFCNAVDDNARRIGLNAMIRSIKNHIDGLFGKAYIDIAGTPDFIIMFVPVEAAYITAMQQDHELWEYAYARKILLISPTNLIPATKMIRDLWQRDSINRDAAAIADRAVKLYEKMVGFIDSFEMVGKELDQSMSKWNEARKQLHVGKGNIINQGIQLKQLLDKKSNKTLPDTLIDLADSDE